MTRKSFLWVACDSGRTGWQMQTRNLPGRFVLQDGDGEMMATRRVAITQPYVPEYRVPLFDLIVRGLQAHDVEARVFFGLTVEAEQFLRSRGNARTPEWAEQVPLWVGGVPGQPKIRYRVLPQGWRDAPLLTEMQAVNGNAWRARARRQPFVMLGHGKGYISNESRLSIIAETVLNRGSSHALTYMPSGRAEVLRRTGLPPERVSTFYNSTDTTDLQRALAAVDDAETNAFRQSHGIPSDARVALFLGALTTYKRLDLLADAAGIVLARDPQAWLIVCGNGPQAPRVEKMMQASDRVVFLGHAGPSQYAPAAKLARVLVNPGRIGLLAVDSIAMGLPIVSSSGARHAPEIEYLDETDSVDVTAADPSSFAEAWLRRLTRRDPVVMGEVPTIERSAGIIIDTLVRSFPFA